MLTVHYRKIPDGVKCSALRLGVEGAQRGEWGICWWRQLEGSQHISEPCLEMRALGPKAPKGQRFHISSECLSWVGSGILCLQLVLGEWLRCRVGRGTEEAKYWNLCLGVSVVFKKAGVSDNQDPRGKQCLSVVSCGAQMHPTWKYLLCLSFYSTWVVFIY